MAAVYRCVLLGQAGHMDAVEEIIADTDALEIAQRVFGHRMQHLAFELWRGGKRIHAEPRPPDPNSPA
jgi:hypothetical protein